MDRLETFLQATDDRAAEPIALRTLTLHMLEHLAPGLFAQRHLATTLADSLERCRTVPYDFAGTPDGLMAGLDAWFCRTRHGLPHPAPNPKTLADTLRDYAARGELIYAWLLGEIAAGLGVDVRVPLPSERPFRPGSQVHDAYFLTHLVLLDTDYFARPGTHPKAEEWADDLEALVPWLTRQPNVDLAGEVAFCLFALGRDPSAAMALVRDAPITADTHEQATVLLALSVEAPVATRLWQKTRKDPPGR